MKAVSSIQAPYYLIEVLAHERFAKTVLAAPAMVNADRFAVILADGRALEPQALDQFRGDDRVVVVQDLEADLEPLIRRLQGGDYRAGAILVHGLTTAQAEVSLRLAERLGDARTFYFCYGGELYSRLSAKGLINLYDHDRWWARIFDVVLLLRRHVGEVGVWKAPVIGPRIAEFMSRLDYLVTLFPSDAAYWSQLLGHVLKRLPYVYPVSVDLLEARPATVRNTIFINHSASRTGNHDYVLNVLRDRDLGGLTLVLPLSYGNPRYVTRIKKLTAHLAHVRVEVLEAPLPLAEYAARCASAVVAIYGHRRQEAVGNIFIMLAAGARVYLRRDNPLYRDLLSLKLVVFSLEDDFDAFGVSTLSKYERNANLAQVRAYVSPEAWRSYYRAILDTLH